MVSESAQNEEKHGRMDVRLEEDAEKYMSKY